MAQLSADLALGDFLRLGPGELKSGGFRRKSILADALEALIGCIYLEQGLEKSQAFVLGIFKGKLANLPSEDALKDPKSRLQEFLQSRGHEIPDYELMGVEGEAHRQTFTAECRIPVLNIITQGISSSRRKAEQDAAAVAFKQVLEHHG